MNRQSGFTLVEIAIVLVVIGLLLGGVLKGQELIMNAKVRNALNDYNGIAAARFAYQDRYRRLPGDDETASGRWSSVTDGNGNGTIDGNNDYSAGTASGTNPETGLFWRHLRNDRLVGGDITSAALPPNAFDGFAGVHDSVLSIAGSPVICHSSVPFKAAVVIDTRLDDGASDAGTVRSIAEPTNGDISSGSANTSYTEAAAPYVTCREM